MLEGRKRKQKHYSSISNRSLANKVWYAGVARRVGAGDCWAPCQEQHPHQREGEDEGEGGGNVVELFNWLFWSKPNIYNVCISQNKLYT